MRALCIIPARGGSKGLPGKNVAPVAGRPVIAHVIAAALAARRVARVVVSTDGADIAAVARACGVDVVDRPAEFATDTAPIDGALRHAVRACEATDGRYDAVVWLQANVPTVEAAVVDEAVARLQETGADSVATVVEYPIPPQWAWRLDGDRMVPLEGCYSYTVRRQDVVPAFHLNGAVNAFRRDVLMDAEGQPGQAYFGRDRRAFVQRREDAVEIDDALDLLLAELVLQRRAASAAGTA